MRKITMLEYCFGGEDTGNNQKKETTKMDSLFF